MTRCGISLRVASAEMASHLDVRTPSLSLRHGIRCITQVGITVEDVLLDVAERVGHETLFPRLE